MAEEIQIAGAGTTAKTRNPVAVAVFTVITLGIYLVCWWYFINRELADSVVRSARASSATAPASRRSRSSRARS